MLSILLLFSPLSHLLLFLKSSKLLYFICNLPFTLSSGNLAAKTPFVGENTIILTLKLNTLMTQNFKNNMPLFLLLHILLLTYMLLLLMKIISRTCPFMLGSPLTLALGPFLLCPPGRLLATAPARIP